MQKAPIPTLGYSTMPKPCILHQISNQLTLNLLLSCHARNLLPHGLCPLLFLLFRFLCDFLIVVLWPKPAAIVRDRLCRGCLENGLLLHLISQSCWPLLPEVCDRMACKSNSKLMRVTPEGSEGFSNRLLHAYSRNTQLMAHLWGTYLTWLREVSWDIL